MKTLKYTILIILFVSSINCVGEKKRDKPNVIIMLVDDMGWPDLGCYAQDDFHETPAIDKMAREGMRFTDAYATCAVCSPTRASIHCGKYPSRIKITDWIPGHGSGSGGFITPKFRYELPLEEVTIADALKRAGYNTYHVGKWHLGQTPEYYPEHQGFDVNIGGHKMGAPGSYYFPYAEYQNELIDWTVLNLPEGHKKNDYLTDKFTDHALDLIEKSHEESKPFFLNMSYYTVHVPLDGKLDLVDKYKKKFEDGDYTHKNFHYAAMIQSLDESVGRIMNKLKELGIDEETFIVFTSDNGGIGNDERFPGNAPLKLGKGYYYEGGIREPFIIRWPGKIKSKTVSKQIITSVDIYPTILSVAGVDIPQRQTIDGVNLEPMFDDPDMNLGRSDIFWHYPHYHRGGPVAAIRSDNYKLIESLEDGSLELYDLDKDIGETNNLAEAMPEKAQELRVKLHVWQDEIDAAPLLKRTPENEKYARSGIEWAGANNIKNPPVFNKNENRDVVISTFNEATIRYTLDGSDPGMNSTKYETPIPVPDGARIKAKTWSENGISSDIEEFIVPVPGVKITLITSENKNHPASMILDEEPGSWWESDGKKLPQEIVFDLGEEKAICGFIYTPARRIERRKITLNSLSDDNTHGALKDYEIQLNNSLVEENWKTVMKGSLHFSRYAFLDEKKVYFKTPEKARYFKIKLYSSINNGKTVNVENLAFIPVKI